MRAVVLGGRGGPEVFEVREVPTPEPLGDQVRVRAAGLNRADLMQGRGHYPAPPGAPAEIPGLEFAGEVDALGPACIGPLKLGDRVFGIVGGGGLAEFVVTHERLAVAIPANLGFEAAAAVPEAFITAHDALNTRAGLRPGERVLIQAATGGVGNAAVQLAHAMGCTVFGTSRTAAKLARAAAFGIDVPIDTSTSDFVRVVADQTGGAGVPVVMDHIGAPCLAGNLDALAPLGRLVLVGLLGGSKAEIELRTLLTKRLTIVGTTLRARPLDEKIAATRRFVAEVVPWLLRGTVRPVVDRAYPLAEVRAGLQRLESGDGFGKVILQT